MERAMRHWAAAWAMLFTGLLVGGCSNTRNGSNDSIFVIPSSATVTAVAGGSQTLHLSFYTTDGNSASRLAVTSDLGTMPAGWSAPQNFQCATVGTGNGCVLDITYAPLTVGSGSLTLTFSYVNNAGVPLEGSVAIPYSATPDNHIVATASPSGQVVVVSNASRAVSITFTSDNGNPATGMTLTTDLASLPAGWSSSSNSFACARVTTGAACQLALTYAPVGFGSGLLTLGYSYTDSAGRTQNGSVTIPYAATVHDNVSGSPNPTSLKVFTGSTTAVSVTFDTDDGNPASALVLTTDLSTLPAGWSGPSGQFSCTIVSSGAGCRLNLSYAPNVADSGTLTLNFSYIDNAGAAKTASVSVTYLATVAHFYFTNAASNSIEYCNVAGDGTVSNCQDTGGGGFDFPLGIAFQGAYLYVANFLSNTVSLCAVNGDGTLDDCTSTGSGFSGPMSVTLNPSGTLAYITNNNGSGPTVCSVGVDGALSACTPGFSGINGTAGIAFVGNGQQAYMTASTTANLFLCTVATDGTFSGCTDTGINTNYAFTAAVDGGNLYFTAENGLSGSGAMACAIGAAGALSDCQQTAVGAPSDNILFNGGLVYLATDGGPSGLFMCTLNQDGTVTGCVPQTDPAILSPWGMAIH
jgi:hypothetical protein